MARQIHIFVYCSLSFTALLAVFRPAFITSTFAAPGTTNPTTNPNSRDETTGRRSGRFADLRRDRNDREGVEDYLEEIEIIDLERRQRQRDLRRPYIQENYVYPEGQGPGYFSDPDTEEPFVEDLLTEPGLPMFLEAERERRLEAESIRFTGEDWIEFTENEYHKGWGEDDKPGHRTFINYEKGAVKLRVYGSANIQTSYGHSWYLSDKDKDDPNARANARSIRDGFRLDMTHTLHIRGLIGRKVSVKADIEKGRAIDDWQVKYTGDQREFIDYVRVGNFPLKFGKSEFLVWEKTSKQTVGAEARMSRGKLSFHVVATLTKGEHGSSTFRGQTQEAREVVRDYRYERRKYYQLEPYCAYDFLCGNTKPSITSAAYNPNLPNSASQNLITLTSVPTSDGWLKNNNVSINGASLEVYLQETRVGEPSFAIGSLGTFRKMRPDEYKFNGTSGVIEFRNSVRYDKTIVVRYRRTGGDALRTSDPAALIENDPQGGGTQKIQVVIKGRIGLEEDTDHDGIIDVIKVSDGVTNRDVYEIKGVYDLNSSGDGQIRQDNFELTIRNINNEILQIPQGDPLSRYEVDFDNGVVLYQLREPFRALKDNQGDFIFEYFNAGNRVADKIYSENLNTDKSDFTRATVNATFYRKVRSYRLQPNIIPGTVRVKVDGEVVRSSKYFVENFEGVLVFLDENDPYIGPETNIFVTYEYSPFGASGQQGYVAGVRSEYRASRDITLGSSVMFNGQFNPAEAPRVGEAPTSKIVLEGDVDVDFNEERVTRLVNNTPFVDFDLLPVRVKGYAEYARTYFNPNTYGMALIDDMESSEDVTDVSINAANWQLASPPSNPTDLGQDGRSHLRYRYYYDPSDVNRGLLPLDTEFESARTFNPPYTAVAGPYNVAEGHLDLEQVRTDQGLRQTSLVLDFDFTKIESNNTTAPRYVSIGSPLSRIGKDLSTINYIEFNAQLLPSLSSGDPRPSSGVQVHFDLGILNEDADGDKTSVTAAFSGLDTEDQGYRDGLDNESSQNSNTELNRHLDKERDNIKNREDRGFLFNFPNGGRTRVGAGPGVWNLFSGGSSLSDEYPSTIGNGVLNTEDWNQDNVLDTTEQVFTFDDNNIAAGKLHPVQGNSFLVSRDEWRQFRIYINRANLTEEEKTALQKVFAIRLWVTPAGGNNNQAGRLMIDGIRFAGSKWRNIRGRTDLEGNPFDIEDPGLVRLANIDTFSAKEEYLDDSFIRNERTAYEEIHGKKTNTEIQRIQEAALKFEFNGNESPSLRELTATRTIASGMDFSYYRKVRLWVNYRSGFSSQTKFIFRVGSSDTDYWEFEAPIDISGWQRLDYSLKSSAAVRKSGRVNLRAIKRLVIGVRNPNQAPSGEIWINDITVADPIILQDDAYVYRTSVAITKPFYKTPGGVPIIGDLQIDYTERQKGANFSTIGQQANGIFEFKRTLNARTDVIGKYWTTQYSYLYEHTRADPDLVDLLASQNGVTYLREHGTVNQFAYVDYNWLPVFTVGYKYRRFEGDRTEQIDDAITNTKLDREIHEEEDTDSPTLQIKETLPEFWNVRLQANYALDVRFYERRREEKTEGNEFITASEYYDIIREQAETNKAQLDLSIGKLSISPSAEYGHDRLLKQNNPDQINRQPLGENFYAPLFEEPDDFRYRNRDHKAELNVTWADLWVFQPTLQGGGSYSENNFADNNYVSITEDEYERLKGASTTVNHTISIPATARDSKPILGFIQNFTPSYTRELTLIEQKLPFTSQTPAFEEDYGLRRTVPPIGDRVFNIVKFPYWHYYQTKNRSQTSLANARDYVYDTRMEIDAPNVHKDKFVSYDNGLTFRDNFTTNTIFSFWDPLTFSLSTSVEQTTTRQNIEGLPSQNGRWSVSLDQTYDLMKILDFWFWGPGKPGDPIHRSRFNVRYNFARQQLITQNKQRDTNSVEPSITFSWGYTSLIFSFGLDIAYLREFEYISEKGPEVDRLIYDTIPEVPPVGLNENTYTYRPGVKYITQLPWLRLKFEDWMGIRLLANPRYTAALTLDINRYEFDNVKLLPTVARDLVMLKQTLDLNLHANLTGGFDFVLAYDVARNPKSNKTDTEKIGMELGLGLKILF